MDCRWRPFSWNKLQVHRSSSQGQRKSAAWHSDFIASGGNRMTMSWCNIYCTVYQEESRRPLALRNFGSHAWKCVHIVHSTCIRGAGGNCRGEHEVLSKGRMQFGNNICLIKIHLVCHNKSQPIILYDIAFNETNVLFGMKKYSTGNGKRRFYWGSMQKVHSQVLTLDEGNAFFWNMLVNLLLVSNAHTGMKVLYFKLSFFK